MKLAKRLLGLQSPQHKSFQECSGVISSQNQTGNKTKSENIHPELPSEDKEGWGGERGCPRPRRPAEAVEGLSAAGGMRRGPRLGPQPEHQSGTAAHLAPSSWASIFPEDAALWGQRTFLKGPEHRIFASSHSPGASEMGSGMVGVSGGEPGVGGTGEKHGEQLPGSGCSVIFLPHHSNHFSQGL